MTIWLISLTFTLMALWMYMLVLVHVLIGSSYSEIMKIRSHILYLKDIEIGNLYLL